MIRCVLIVGFLTMLIQIQQLQGELVNLSKEDWFKSMMCISTSKQQKICDEFLECKNRYSPEEREKNFRICQPKIVGDAWKCDDNNILFTEQQLSDAFDCVDKGLVYNKEDEQKMVKYQNCALDVAAKVC